MALKNSLNLGQVTQMELQSIRHIAGAHKLMSTKFSCYADQCQDPQIKQMFEKAGQDAQMTAQNLTNSL